MCDIVFLCDKLINLIDIGFICTSFYDVSYKKYVCHYTRFIDSDKYYSLYDNDCIFRIFSNKLCSYIPINKYDRFLFEFRDFIVNC